MLNGTFVHVHLYIVICTYRRGPDPSHSSALSAAAGSPSSARLLSLAPIPRREISWLHNRNKPQQADSNSQESIRVKFFSSHASRCFLDETLG